MAPEEPGSELPQAITDALSRACPNMSKKSLALVEDKLLKIGADTVDKLMYLLQARANRGLNAQLKAAGFKTFSSKTLITLRQDLSLPERGETFMLASPRLQTALQRCGIGWGTSDFEVAEEKLAALGVKSVWEFKALVSMHGASGLNEQLRSHGLKPFSRDTLHKLREEASQLLGDDESISPEFEEFLQLSRPHWRPWDIIAAADKLRVIGITSTATLMEALACGPKDDLNEQLRASGQKEFVPATMAAWRNHLGIPTREGEGSIEFHLEEFLRNTCATWSDKDILAAGAKLQAVGIEDLATLSEALACSKNNDLNERLRQSGQKGFVPATLDVWRRELQISKGRKVEVSIDPDLEEFLRNTSASWTQQDIVAAARKLQVVGVVDKKTLVQALAVGGKYELNRRLQDKDQKAFARATLVAWRRELGIRHMQKIDVQKSAYGAGSGAQSARSDPGSEERGEHRETQMRMRSKEGTRDADADAEQPRASQDASLHADSADASDAGELSDDACRELADEECLLPENWLMRLQAKNDEDPLDNSKEESALTADNAVLPTSGAKPTSSSALPAGTDGATVTRSTEDSSELQAALAVAPPPKSNDDSSEPVLEGDQALPSKLPAASNGHVEYEEPMLGADCKLPLKIPIESNEDLTVKKGGDSPELCIAIDKVDPAISQEDVPEAVAPKAPELGEDQMLLDVPLERIEPLVPTGTKNFSKAVLEAGTPSEQHSPLSESVEHEATSVSHLGVSPAELQTESYDARTAEPTCSAESQAKSSESNPAENSEESLEPDDHESAVPSEEPASAEPRTVINEALRSETASDSSELVHDEMPAAGAECKSSEFQDESNEVALVGSKEDIMMSTDCGVPSISGAGPTSCAELPTDTRTDSTEDPLELQATLAEAPPAMKKEDESNENFVVRTRRAFSETCITRDQVDPAGSQEDAPEAVAPKAPDLGADLAPSDQVDPAGSQEDAPEAVAPKVPAESSEPPVRTNQEDFSELIHEVQTLPDFSVSVAEPQTESNEACTTEPTCSAESQVESNNGNPAECRVKSHQPDHHGSAVLGEESASTETKAVMNEALYSRRANDSSELVDVEMLLPGVACRSSRLQDKRKQVCSPRSRGVSLVSTESREDSLQPTDHESAVSGEDAAITESPAATNQALQSRIADDSSEVADDEMPVVGPVCRPPELEEKSNEDAEQMSEGNEEPLWLQFDRILQEFDSVEEFDSDGDLAEVEVVAGASKPVASGAGSDQAQPGCKSQSENDFVFAGEHANWTHECEKARTGHSECSSELSKVFTKLCPAGHQLTQEYINEEGWYCSECNCELPMGVELQSCRACDYDICMQCVFFKVVERLSSDIELQKRVQEMSSRKFQRKIERLELKRDAACQGQNLPGSSESSSASVDHEVVSVSSDDIVCAELQVASDDDATKELTCSVELRVEINEAGQTESKDHSSEHVDHQVLASDADPKPVRTKGAIADLRVELNELTFTDDASLEKLVDALNHIDETAAHGEEANDSEETYSVSLDDLADLNCIWPHQEDQKSVTLGLFPDAAEVRAPADKQSRSCSNEPAEDNGQADEQLSSCREEPLQQITKVMDAAEETGEVDERTPSCRDEPLQQNTKNTTVMDAAGDTAEVNEQSSSCRDEPLHQIPKVTDAAGDTAEVNEQSSSCRAELLQQIANVADKAEGIGQAAQQSSSDREVSLQQINTASSSEECHAEESLAQNPEGHARTGESQGQLKQTASQVKDSGVIPRYDLSSRDANCPQKRVRIVPMGQNCPTAAFLISRGWREQSLPFDYCSATFKVWDHCLRDDFSTILPDKPVPCSKGKGKCHPYDLQFSNTWMFLHHPGWADEFREKMSERVERLKSILREKTAFGLAFYCEGKDNTHYSRPELVAEASAVAMPSRGFQHILVVWFRAPQWLQPQWLQPKFQAVTAHLTFLFYTPKRRMMYYEELELSDAAHLARLIRQRFQPRFPDVFHEKRAAHDDEVEASLPTSDDEQLVPTPIIPDDQWDFARSRRRP